MTASAQTNHFNLHVNGVGYVNRVRWVEPRRNAGRRADPFLACSVSAIRGNAESPDYTYFDLRVSGSEAIEMVERLKVDVEEKRKVFIAFRIGDIYPHMYERDVRRDGSKTGEKEMAMMTTIGARTSVRQVPKATRNSQRILLMRVARARVAVASRPRLPPLQQPPLAAG